MKERLCTGCFSEDQVKRLDLPLCGGCKETVYELLRCIQADTLAAAKEGRQPRTPLSTVEALQAALR